MWRTLLALASVWQVGRVVEGGCPFQNPFWFYDRPVVVNVYDEAGAMVANKVRVMWGRMENFKCVDYFQVEFFQALNPMQTVQMTERINRHRRSVEVEVVPCTEYYFKVIASEDWKGMREDFKVFSEVVQFTVEYTPKFINPPLVKERGKSPPQPARPGPPGDQRPRPPPPTGYQDQQAQAPMYPYYQGNLAGGRLDREDLASFWGNGGGGGGGSGAQRMPPAGGATPAAPVPPADLDYTIKVGWRLKDVDYPICLDYFELDYYDTTYNSSAYLKRFERPFQRPRFELEVSSLTVPCEPDYDFIARAYGFNKQFSRSHWTPPSCVRSTPPPTTTLAASEDVATVTDSSGEVVTTTESLQEKLDAVQAENDKLQAKIDGLKQEYEKIGLQVFAAFKESFFQGLEDFLARRRTVLPGGHAEGGSPGGVSAANATDPLFGG